MPRRTVISTVMIAAGVVLGLVGARYVFVNSGLSLIPWGVASVLIGVVSTSRKHAIIDAGVFGFALAVSFMAFSYDGSNGVASVIVPFSLLGLVGAACAIVLALLGRVVRARASR
ncbi:MAG: hypothetical protein QOJ72_2266 [Nocardioidaceae bacterium]|nr:hypothetical protein [Nocardioidaceae bacterium]